MGHDLKEEVSGLKSCILNLAKCTSAEELKRTAQEALDRAKRIEANPDLELVSRAKEMKDTIDDLKDQMDDMQDNFKEDMDLLKSRHSNEMQKLKDDLKDANDTIKIMAEQEHNEAAEKVEAILGNEIMDKLTSVEITLNNLVGSVDSVELLTKKMNLVSNATGKTVNKLLNADANLADLVRSYIRKSERSLEEVKEVKKNQTSINDRINEVNEEYTEIVEQNSEITNQLEETNNLVDDLRNEVNEAKEEVKGFREIFRKISSFFGSKHKE